MEPLNRLGRLFVNTFLVLVDEGDVDDPEEAPVIWRPPGVGGS